MIRLPCRSCSLAAFLFAICVSSPTLADEVAQVEALEQLSLEFDKLNASATAYADALEKVRDAQSAEGATDQIDYAGREFVSALEAIAPLIEAGKKGQVIATTPDLQARLRPVMQKQPQQVQLWISQSRRYAIEIQRLGDVSGLPSRFWNVLNVQTARILIASEGPMKAAGAALPQSLIKYTTDKLALYDKYGPEKVVDIGIEGGRSTDSDNLEVKLRTALGGGVAAISLPGARGIVLTVAPVEQLKDVVKAIDKDSILQQDEARRRVKIRVSPTGPAFALRNLAGRVPPIGARNFPFPTPSDAAARVVPASPTFDDVVPPKKRVTIELLNRHEIARSALELKNKREPAGLAGDLIRDLPSREDSLFENLGLLLKLAAKSEKFSYESKDGSYRVGPISDFDAYVKSLDFAMIVERDNATRSLKIKVDPALLTDESILKRVGSGSKLDHFDRMRLGLDAKGLASAARSKQRREAGQLNPGEGTDPSDAALLKGSGLARPVTSGKAASSSLIPDADLDYARLADLLHEGSVFERRDAIKELLQIEPSSVKDNETKKRIARGFREIAFASGASSERGDAIRGLVLWGGKYANPLLVDLLDREKLAALPEVFDGLAMLKEPQGAAAACRQLGNFFNHDAAVACLRKMGPAAEDALIKAAPSNDPKVSLAAVNLLGEVGTTKSTDLLNRATKSKNLDIRDAARAAMKSIRERNKAESSKLTTPAETN